MLDTLLYDIIINMSYMLQVLDFSSSYTCTWWFRNKYDSKRILATRVKLSDAVQFLRRINHVVHHSILSAVRTRCVVFFIEIIFVSLNFFIEHFVEYHERAFAAKAMLSKLRTFKVIAVQSIIKNNYFLFYSNSIKNLKCKNLFT